MRNLSFAIAKSAAPTSWRDATFTIAAPCGVWIAPLTVPDRRRKRHRLDFGAAADVRDHALARDGIGRHRLEAGRFGGGLEVRRGLQLCRERLGALPRERHRAILNHVVTHAAPNLVELRHVRVLLGRHVEQDAPVGPGIGALTVLSA